MSINNTTILVDYGTAIEYDPNILRNKARMMWGIDEFKITHMSALPVTIMISFEIFLFFLKI